MTDYTKCTECGYDFKDDEEAIGITTGIIRNVVEETSILKKLIPRDDNGFYADEEGWFEVLCKSCNDKRRLPDEIKEAILRVNKYRWKDEKKHFEVCKAEGNVKGHLFIQMKLVEEYFNGRNTTPQELKGILDKVVEEQRKNCKGCKVRKCPALEEIVFCEKYKEGK